MPPYMYWHSDEAKIVYRGPVFKNRVLKTDTYKGWPTKWDVVYGGGIRIVRSTMAVAEVSGGRLLEIGFREDLRKPGEVCSAFHARYR